MKMDKATIDELNYLGRTLGYVVGGKWNARAMSIIKSSFIKEIDYWIKEAVKEERGR
jgi:hypothetical protein